MEKPTATPRPKTEATSSNASKTIINDISAEYVSAISAFFQKVGVSHSNSIPDFCNTKYFYSHLIRDAIKPDQVLRGRITCHLTVTPILAVTISPLFFSNSSFFSFFSLKVEFFFLFFHGICRISMLRYMEGLWRQLLRWCQSLVLEPWWLRIMVFFLEIWAFHISPLLQSMWVFWVHFLVAQFVLLSIHFSCYLLLQIKFFFFFWWD